MAIPSDRTADFSFVDILSMLNLYGEKRRRRSPFASALMLRTESKHLRNPLSKLVQALVRHAVDGRIVHSKNLYPWQGKREVVWTSKSDTVVPGPAYSRLTELKARYSDFDPRVTSPALWDEQILSDEDIRNFRGDNAYVYQRPDMNMNEVACALSYYYLKSGSAADLLDAMEEDGAFGALTLELDGRLVSRDLLDSVGEIDFLRRHTELGRKQCSVLDIGAGYGRLAHRLYEAVGRTTDILATDAFATSTMLCEYYLAYRKTSARTVPLDEVQDVLQSSFVDIATNIHSFSECTLDAIEWWVTLLAKSNVRYLMVLPNNTHLNPGRCLTNRGEDMIPLFERLGYNLEVCEPRHADVFVQRFGMDPCSFFLFRLRESDAVPPG